MVYYRTGSEYMPAYHDKKLYLAADEEDAEYVEIASAFHGCKVTEGQIYRLERNYNNPHIFENGEAYVVDDETRDNYSVFMLCKIVLYK
ncbi:hypothetical protein MKY19_23620 [Paenibacillus sp. FSL R5-0744]|uniref:hypothetical protein n=2 Tax=unclassified Paenibacillus TaxID=185978 RepID=UPI0030DD2315